MSAKAWTLHVTDGEVPPPEVIAARIELGSAEYHEHCCTWLLWSNDETLFDSMPACDCGGPEMAKAYVEQAAEIQRLREGA